MKEEESWRVRANKEMENILQGRYCKMYNMA
jgi:hypothetical protein